MQYRCFLPMQYHLILPFIYSSCRPLLLPENSNYLLKGETVVVRGDIRLLALPSLLYQRIPQIIGIQEIQKPHAVHRSCAGGEG
jgi:hypothetical protein